MRLIFGFILVALLFGPSQAQAQAEVQIQGQATGPSVKELIKEQEKDKDKNGDGEQPNAPLPLPYKYTGNTYSHKFHRPRCPYCKVMAAAKRMPFHFRCQAVAAGYAPCRYCLPAQWTTVRAAIHIDSLNSLNSSDSLASQDKNTAPPPAEQAGQQDTNIPLGETHRETDICKP
jgi:hypothetical protein